MGLKISWERKAPSEKKIIKDTNRLKKHVASTLDWMEIYKVEEHRMIVEGSSSRQYVRGIKIRPIDIFILSEMEQAMIIARLRAVYNSIDFELFHCFVFNPVNLDADQSRLERRIMQEESKEHRELMEDDLLKMGIFVSSWKELEFYICIQHDDEEVLEEQFRKLQGEFSSAGFVISVLNKIDYQNYAAYLFENQLINDFYFNEGAFAVLRDSEESEVNQQNVENGEDDDA